MKRTVLVKCSITTSDKLAARLVDFLKDGFPVDMRDQNGQTALHHAIKAAKHGAVKKLLYQGKASVMKKDARGRSPLNVAIQEAVHKSLVSGPGVDTQHCQKSYTNIINLLVKHGAHVDDKDHDGRTPWDYADKGKHQWITRLKEKHLIFGTSSTSSVAVDYVIAPQTAPQREACNEFNMILAEVFLQKKGNRLSEVFNIDMASVYDVIYKGQSGVSRVLAESRPEKYSKDRVRCRWIHVPSNNEQWVHDLMISMGIQDGSMSGQRHEGSRLIDRYMMPQAKRYKNYHSVPRKPEPKPRAVRYGSADSANTVVLGPQEGIPVAAGETGNKMRPAANKTPLPSQEAMRTEADAIVIFVSISPFSLAGRVILCTYLQPVLQMPMLGFETHRHRKFLTQAFREADNALRAARARENSPDARPVVNTKAVGSRTGARKRPTETSDGGESSSENEEKSRLYPADSPVVQLRAQREIKTKREARLLLGYLDSKNVKPVHCRRTLDQFSYYMLNSTEARDRSQVVYRWAKNSSACAEAKNRPIIMVDQLWLWAFHDGTIITSAPNTWNADEEFNLSRVLVKELVHNKDRPIIKSVEDLLHLILRTSVDFFRRKGPANCQFHECFQSSINAVSEEQGNLFEKFRRTIKTLHRSTLDPTDRKKQIEFLFTLEKETELLVEIMDIQDELTIVKTILGQQYDVLKMLLRLYPKRAEEDDGDERGAPPGSSLGNNELMVLQSLVQLLKDRTLPASELKGSMSFAGPAFINNTGILHNGDTRSPTIDEPLGNSEFARKIRPNGKEKEEQPKTTPSAKRHILQNRDLMYETIGIVENNIRIVTDMLAYAQKVENSVCHCYFASLDLWDRER